MNAGVEVRMYREGITETTGRLVALPTVHSI